MGSYVLSTANRYYVALEQSYGVVPAITSANRLIATQLQAQQVVSASVRRDKTGSRSFAGHPQGGQRHSAFQVRSLLTSGSNGGVPWCGALVQAAFGGAAQVPIALSVAATPDALTIQSAAAHGLSAGSALTSGSEIRFITEVPDAMTMKMNAPFSTQLEPGATMWSALTYPLAATLPSVSLFDYWDPAGAISRIVAGAAVNTMTVSVDSDVHELIFEGAAADVIDSASFVAGEGGLSSFPAEPAQAQTNYSIVPGHLGQAWIGNPAGQFFTVTQASIQLTNNLRLRSQEMGSALPAAISPGKRSVTVDFRLMAQSDAQTGALYQIAKARGTLAAMLQLGQQPGQMMALFLPEVTPQIPSFDDTGELLAWQFTNNQASGVAENELQIAFA